MRPDSHKRFLLTSVFLFLATVAQGQEPAKVQKIVEQGIAIELTLEPLAQKATAIRAAEDVNVKFTVTDTTSGTPVKGLNLSAWISMRGSQSESDPARCREKIQSYLTGSLRARPEVDLNSYYVLALNRSPDISVIDPLLGFGGSKLLTLVMLKSPGADWVLTRDGEKLFVTLPLVNQVAVIDTRNWKVASYIDTGVKPSRLAVQPDQQYLWVAHEGSETEVGGVTVIDTTSSQVAARIPTSTGQHDLVVGNDNRFVFVSNHQSGTVSVIDVRNLAKLEDIKVGPGPVSLALSELSKAVYVASETDGVITVIGQQDHEILARIKAVPGARSIRFAPGGRYGFVLNTQENLVNIFDAASNRLLHEIKVGKAPDQIVFSETFAFVRSLETEHVTMLRLSSITNEVDITDFPGGQAAPGKGNSLRADSLVLAPEGNSVIVANPVDKVIYYYTEGMAAPMGNFQNYRREPLAVMVVDRSLREVKPGVYSTTIKLPASGKYDVAFVNDSPRVAHCFEARAEPNPALKEERPIALRVDYQVKERNLPVGQDYTLRFKLTDTTTDQPKSDLKDVRVLTFLSPGVWQHRDFAKSLGDGFYEIQINVPQSGMYMVFVESSSMGVNYRDLPHLVMHASENARR